MEARLSSHLELIDALGAGDIQHSNTDLGSHLVGTYKILKGWAQEQAVCDAGLFHSLYGTDRFGRALLDKSERARLRGQIGDTAEALVYLFSRLRREDLYRGRVIDRESCEVLDASESTIDALCHLSAANWLEQAARTHSLKPRAFRAMASRLCAQARQTLDISPPRTYKTIDVQATGPIGAEITGIDLSAATELQLRELREAWLEHQLIVVRDQELSATELLAVAKVFGEAFEHPYMCGLADYPKIAAIIKEPQHTQNFGPGWHTDSPYLTAPPIATLLYAVEVPEVGGDTLFADQYGAYETLDDDFRAMAETITTINRANRAYTFYKEASHGMKLASEADMSAEHPLVIRHPETGRKSIYLSPSHIQASRSTALEGDLLELVIIAICHNSVRDQLITRLSWTPGTIAIWDNRCAIHSALNDYQGHRREMQRIIVRER